MALFEMPIAGASSLYVLCILFTSWRDWCCLCLLPTQLWRDGSPHSGTDFPRSHLPETPSCISAEISLVSYGLFYCWEMCLCIIVSLIQMKGLLHLPLSLSAKPSHHRRECGQGNMSSDSPIWMTCEQRSRNPGWYCLVCPSSRNWWNKGGSGSYTWTSAASRWTTRKASASSQICIWQCGNYSLTMPTK